MALPEDLNCGGTKAPALTRAPLHAQSCLPNRDAEGSWIVDKQTKGQENRPARGTPVPAAPLSASPWRSYTPPETHHVLPPRPFEDTS